MGYDENHSSDPAKFGPVFACINIIAQEMARIPIEHQRIDENGSVVKVLDRAPARVFHKPNHYQTSSDWMLYLMYSLLTTGNAYCLATRNNRNEVIALYPLNPRAVWPYITPPIQDSPMGEVYYRVSKDPTSELSGADLDEENNAWVPQRNMLHVRLFSIKHPLIGQSPLEAAAQSADTGLKITRQMNRFFGNASRPSGVLTHPKTLSNEAVSRLKQSFMNATQGNSFGAPVVLQEAMSWAPMDMSAVDAELINSYNLTTKTAAQVFRLPTFMLGDNEKTTFASVESQLRFFSQTNIGFYADHMEKALSGFFNLSTSERIHFNIEEAMLRGDMKERMEGLKTAVQGGVLTVNEARRFEHLPPVEFGDSPRMQQQMVPLSYGENVQPAPLPGAPTPELPEPEPEDEDESVTDSARRLLEYARG
jgi:HK97 family phage portal protein